MKIKVFLIDPRLFNYFYSNSNSHLLNFLLAFVINYLKDAMNNKKSNHSKGHWISVIKSHTKNTFSRIQDNTINKITAINFILRPIKVKLCIFLLKLTLANF